MKAGDVFRFKKAADKHARVVVSDPIRFPDRLLVVGMTSWDRLEDQSCTLNPGDHSTVKHRTSMNYARSTATGSNAEFDLLVSRGVLELYEPVAPEVLDAIRSGAMRSERMPRELKQMLVDQKLIPRTDVGSS